MISPFRFDCAGDNHFDRQAAWISLQSRSLVSLVERFEAATGRRAAVFLRLKMNLDSLDPRRPHRARRGRRS